LKTTVVNYDKEIQMKTAMVFTALLLGSSISYAGEVAPTCKRLALKAATALMKVDEAPVNMRRAKVSVDLVSSNPADDSTKWRVTFSNAKEEWAKIYTVETLNFGDKTESCFISSVQVDFAG
jgi:hypothetical protein